MSVIIKEASYVIAHVPDFVQYGSKPTRDIEDNPDVKKELDSHLWSYEDAINYVPNQVYIGNMHPDDLHNVVKPWYEHLLKDGKRNGLFGEIMPEDEFYGWMKVADDFDLLWLDPQFIEQIKGKFASHPFVKEAWVKKLGQGKAFEKIKEMIEQGAALPVFYNGKLVGSFRRDHERDDTLKAEVLMENLVAKASGALAMLHLFKLAKITPPDVDFVLDCTETAIGDRYNRGGGSLSKAYAEMVGCTNATGNDIRAFCCAPNHALVNAAGLVESGIYNNVVVAGGGCLAKVGMKSAAHLKHNMPILEDILAGIAFLVTKDDGVSPVMRLDSIGKHDVGAGSPQQAILTSLILKPLNRMGLKMTEIDKYSTELHNPEITLPSGSGDTPATNYKIMASLAVLNKQIDKTELDKFVREKGMLGFCPTQGHVPSAVPFLGHAIKAMKEGKMKRAMFVAKGSLFLGRMSQLSDGISFILEANSKSATRT
jgi:betaine reductase